MLKGIYLLFRVTNKFSSQGFMDVMNSWRTVPFKFRLFFLQSLLAEKRPPFFWAQNAQKPPAENAGLFFSPFLITLVLCAL